jgi:hypothetical protein
MGTCLRVDDTVEDAVFRLLLLLPCSCRRGRRVPTTLRAVYGRIGLRAFLLLASKGEI